MCVVSCRVGVVFVAFFVACLPCGRLVFVVVVWSYGWLAASVCAVSFYLVVL